MFNFLSMVCNAFDYRKVLINDFEKDLAEISRYNLLAKKSLREVLLSVQDKAKL